MECLVKKKLIRKQFLMLSYMGYWLDESFSKERARSEFFVSPEGYYRYFRVILEPNLETTFIIK